MTNARNVEAGGAFVRLFTEESGLVRGLRSADKRFHDWASKINTAGKTLLTVGLAASAPLLTSVKVFADQGSALNDLSARTGDSVESLSKLQFAAAQTGTDFESLEGGLRKLNSNVGDALSGNAAAAESFNRLGLSARELSQLPAEQRLGKIADALSRIPDEARRTAATMDILGRAGTMLLPMLRDGSQGLFELTNRAEELGIVMSTAEAQAADNLGDRLDEIGAVAKRTAISIGSALAPAAQLMADQVLGAATAMREFADANPGVIETVAMATAGVAAGGAGLMAVANTIGAVGSTIGGVSGAWVMLGDTGRAVLKPFSAVASLTASIGRSGATAASSYFALGRATSSVTFAGLRGGAAVVKGMVTPVATVTRLISGIGTASTGVIPAIAKLGGTVAALAAPIVIPSAIAGLGYLIATQTDIGQNAVGQLKQSFSTISVSAGDVGKEVQQRFGDAFDYAKAEAKKLKADVVTTWGGITDAVASGDLSLAGQVAMAGLNVVWQAGVHELSDTWTVGSTIAMSAWNSATASMQRIGENTTATISLLWVDMVNGIADALEWVTRRGHQVTEAVGSLVFDVGITLGTHTEAEKSNFLEPLRQDQQRRSREQSQRQQQADQKRRDIEANRRGGLNGIGLQQQRAETELERHQTEALTASQQRLNKARENLAKIVGKAHTAKAEHDAKQPDAKPTKKRMDIREPGEAKTAGQGGGQRAEATTSGVAASLNRSYMPTGPVSEMNRLGQATDDVTARLRKQTDAIRDRNKALGKAFDEDARQRFMGNVKPGFAGENKPAWPKAQGPAGNGVVGNITPADAKAHEDPAAKRGPILGVMPSRASLMSGRKPISQQAGGDNPFRALPADPVIEHAEKSGIPLPNTGDEYDAIKRSMEAGQPAPAGAMPKLPADPVIEHAEKNGLPLPNTGAEYDALKQSMGDLTSRLGSLELKPLDLSALESRLSGLRMPSLDPPPTSAVEQTIVQSVANSGGNEKLDAMLDQLKQLNANLRSMGTLA